MPACPELSLAAPRALQEWREPREPRGTAGCLEAFTPGRTTLTEGMNISCGGAVANTGIAMHLFGTEVHLVGRAGIDAFGSVLMREMERWGEGLSRDLVVDPGTRTSHSVILAVPGIDRIFLHDSAANQSFGADDVDFDAFPDAGLFHFGYPSHMTRISANGGEELVTLFRRAKERGLLTSLDGGSSPPSIWRRWIRTPLPERRTGARSSPA